MELSPQQRKDLVVELLERRATIGNRHQLLYFRVVTKAVSDLAMTTLSTDEHYTGHDILAGGLDPFLYHLDLSREFLVEALEDAGLLDTLPRQLALPF